MLVRVVSFLLGWLCVLCGGSAGLLGVIVLFRGLIMSLSEQGDEIFMRLLGGFFGALIGGASAAGLIALGAFLLGWG
jgi:hypothetical protein